MKRLGSSDSLGGLMSICPNSTEKYARDLQAMMDGYEEENDCMVEQEACHVEKKRRLSVDQVRALEKNFEVENKLEPERKVKLAQELGLQPRQVAVWFQNRRARWKTKQLERDYGLLKATFDGLKANFDKLQHDNEALVKEIRELKSKINEDGNVNSESKLSVKDDELMSDTDQNTKLENPIPKPVKIPSSENTIDSGNNANRAVFRDHFKDGSSDSDSSAILNDDNNHSSPNHGIINEFLDIHPNINLNNNNNFQFQESSKVTGVGTDDCQQQQQQYVKIEEHNFFGEESCSTFFSDDQAPSLHWYEWS